MGRGTALGYTRNGAEKTENMYYGQKLLLEEKN